MESLILKKGQVKLRGLQTEDSQDLAIQANDKAIFDKVRDYFPNPYTVDDAQAFITATLKEEPKVTFAITYHEQFAGVIGMKLQEDIYHRSAEVGYWLGASFRGKGITPVALALITSYGINTLDLNRLFAGTFSNNPASMRVLEKCGYLFEGVAKQAICKNGEFLDEHRYGYVADKSGN